MDKNEHTPLSLIPMKSLSLRLARSAIKMKHDKHWKIDKLNPTHDLIISLQGIGVYQMDGRSDTFELHPGQAFLIPAHTRFRGEHWGGDQDYIGVAQHFSLDLFGSGDLVRQMVLRDPVTLKHWSDLAPMVRMYREISPFGYTTLAQHHQFMVILLAYLEAAFVDWRTEHEELESQDQLSIQIMMVASRLAADPLGAGLEEALRDVPYNQEYFRRAFRDRLGQTPQKFRELKRMEFAANRLGKGVTVKAVAAELGYSDPYFFSRMFKRYMGTSPSSYREKPYRGRKGPLK
jgi:AraC-like DNA-binding protein